MVDPTTLMMNSMKTLVMSIRLFQTPTADELCLLLRHKLPKVPAGLQKDFEKLPPRDRDLIRPFRIVNLNLMLY